MIKKNFELEKKKYYIKAPSAKVNQKAAKVYSLAFTKNLQDGLMSMEEMADFLKKRKVFTEEDKREEEKLVEDINRLEKELFLGSGDKKQYSIKEGQEKAIQIKENRSKYMTLLAKKQQYEAATADKLADNEKFDFLVSECTFNEDGSRVYNSYEDYDSRADEDLANVAAATLAQMMYDLDDDFVKRLPENQFLMKFGLVDEDLRLVDRQGNLVDLDGRRINELGYYVDEEGNRVDKYGNRLTEEGLFQLDAIYVDENGNEVKPQVEEEPDESDDEPEEKAKAAPKKTTRRKTPAKSSG